MTADARKAYLSMAERRARPGSGSHPAFLRERTAHYGTPALNRYLESMIRLGKLEYEE